ncbi:hypothetical protein LQW54_007630 [Pestalotiopsis sp. IQ-011]
MSLDSSFSTINFGEPEPWSNRRSVILGVIITFLITSWLCVIGRLYVRAKVVRDLGWDDLCVLFYALFTTLGSVCVLLAADRFGLGQHFLLLTPEQMVGYLQTFYVCNASYCTATAFIKEALLLQYLRVYGRGHPMWRFTFVVVVFTALWGVAYSFIAWVPCFPVQGFWGAATGATCYGYGSPVASQFVGTYESHTAINMILDFLVLLIPLPLLVREGSTLKQKLRILGLLIMGSIVIMLAIWRLATIIDHQAATWPTHDPTWYGPISIMLAVLEVDCAAICASIPIFWPVLEARWGTIFITQEIKITHEERHREAEEEEEAAAIGRGDYHSSYSSSKKSSHNHYRSASEVELKRSESDRSLGGTHYNDMFVMHSVDPLRSPTLGQVRTAAVIESDPAMNARDGGKRWF